MQKDLTQKTTIQLSGHEFTLIVVVVVVVWGMTSGIFVVVEIMHTREFVCIYALINIKLPDL